MFQYDLDGDAIMRYVPAVFLEDSPIHRIPEDILYELFVLFVGEPSSECCDLAVLLSHVCSKWRSIVINAPLLWRFAKIYASGPKDHWATVESFIRRSQDQLFSFALYLPKKFCSTSNFIRALRPHAHRLRKLHIVAATFPSLSLHLRPLSALSLPALEHHDATVCSESVPGSFTAACRSSGRFSIFQPPVVWLTVPLWPSYLCITTLSFAYSCLKLSEIFLIIESASSTLEHLKLYFQSRHNLVSEAHWHLIHRPRVDLPQLHSLQLGFDDPLSLVPFLHRVRLPALQSLSIHDFVLSRDADTPAGALFAQIRIPDSLPPLFRFLSTLLDPKTLPHPTRLVSLGLTGLYAPPEEPDDILDTLFAALGPHVRALSLADCDPVFLECLAECLFQNHVAWKLERFTVRGMDNDDLLECLWIRHAHEYPRLKELTLEPYTRPPPREVLVQFAEVVSI